MDKYNLAGEVLPHTAIIDPRTGTLLVKVSSPRARTSIFAVSGPEKDLVRCHPNASVLVETVPPSVQYRVGTRTLIGGAPLGQLACRERWAYQMDMLGSSGRQARCQAKGRA